MKIPVFLGMMLLLIACQSNRPVAEKASPTLLKDPNTDQRATMMYIDATTEMIRGDYPTAGELFREVLKLDPSNHAARYNLAKVQAELRRYEEAALFAREALEADPSNFWYYILLRQIYVYQEQPLQAIAVQQQLTARFPDKLDEQLSLAEMYLKAGDTNKALDIYQSVENKTGPNEETSFRKYRLLHQAGRYEAAARTAGDLIRLDPAQARYYQFQYESLAAAGRQAEAVPSLEALLRLQPGNGVAQMYLADYYKSVGQTRTSDSLLFLAFGNPGIEAEPKLNLLRQLLPLAAQDTTLWPRTHTLATLLRQTHPASAPAWALAGRVALLQQQPDTARRLLRQSLDISPADISVWLDLMETSFEKRNFPQLRADAGEALEYFPTQEQFLYFNGLSAAFLQDYTTAVSSLEKIRRLGKAEPDLMAQTCLELGKIYHAKEDFPRSDDAFRQALQLTPGDPYTLSSYAEALADRQIQLPEARIMAEKALKADPDRPKYQETLGWVLLQAGELELAAPWLQQAALAGTPSALERYGDLLYRQGNKPEAAIQWKKAIEAGATFRIQDKLPQ